VRKRKVEPRGSGNPLNWWRVTMKLLVPVVLLFVSVQALPEMLQIYPPAAARATIRVDNPEDLQGAIDRASPGDVIELTPGVTYTGNFVLPQKPADDDRYITIRTRPSRELPDASGRIGPEHSARLARIQSPNADSAIRTAPGAHHWRLSLLEFGPNAGGAGEIVMFGDGTSRQTGEGRTPHDLAIDRCYIHGDPERGQKRGVAMNSAATTISGSYISDIKSATQDAQAIAAWSGPGPFLVENNYLEASGENIMLGGAVPGEHGLVPSDLVFRRNHVSRPPSWRAEKWSVKNLFELKNARRVLVEGNLFENHWAGAQPGYAIVLTPRGERGAAPWATVEDVTFRHNVIRNVAAVFNLLARDNVGESGTARRIRIAENLIHGVDRARWGGNGTFLQIGEGPAEVTVEHNTIIQSGNIINAYGGTKDARAAVDGFVFRDNLTLHNSNGVIGQGVGIGMQTLSAYFPGSSFTRNVLAGGRASRYPPDNFFPDVDHFAAQFVDYDGQDYRLRPGSEFRSQATDGTDLGVNFIALARAIGSRAREWLGSSSPPDDKDF
jgi:hypothetical protein